MSFSLVQRTKNPALTHLRLFALTRNLEFGDMLLPFYAATFFRQCLWAVDSELTAWVLASVLSVLAWSIYLSTKPIVRGRTPRQFWLVVLLPLFFVFAIRMPFPDISFDVLNQRLIQAERSLRGPQFMSGDFFPMVFPFNPAPDMLTGIFRYLLGYRLGTVINLLVLLWTGTIVEKILRPFVRNNGWRCVCVLLIVFTEHLLFQINNYMVDLLALPLMLEALRLALDYPESNTKHRDLLYAALLSGASVGLKLTNAALVLPVVVVFAIQALSKQPNRRTLRFIGLAAIFFMAPLLPHAFYMWRETGNPVFPLYNNILKSPFWPNLSPYDGRWGPHDWVETPLWPLLTVWVPDRLSELRVYSGRLTLAFTVAVLCLVLPGMNRRGRLVALAVVLSSFLWAATSGYVRYAGFIEVSGGVLVIMLASHVWEHLKNLPRAARLITAGLLPGLLVIQCVIAGAYVQRTEWSRRPTVFDDGSSYLKELRWVWRDRQLLRFQLEENRQLFHSVDAWIVSSVKSNGVAALLRPDVPVLGIVYQEYFDTPSGRARFREVLESHHGKRIYSLSLTDELDASLEVLRRRKFVIGEIKPLSIPYFSANRRMAMSLIEIFPPAMRATLRREADTPVVTEATAPLDDEAFVASFSVQNALDLMRPNERVTLHVLVKNDSEYVWPAAGQKDYTYLITLSDTWLAADGETLVNNTDGRNSLPHDLWPGESVVIPLDIKAPPQRGEYVLEIGLVQEGIAFFKDKGAATWRSRVKVE